MSYLPLEKLLEKSDNSIYKLVILASKRAREISEGGPKSIPNEDQALKPGTVALREIAEGKVRFKKAGK